MLNKGLETRRAGEEGVWISFGIGCSHGRDVLFAEGDYGAHAGNATPEMSEQIAMRRS
jgi:hypothetical protein